MRTVEIMTEVEVDLDDYVDEILEECDDDELIKEVEKRGHRVYRKGNRSSFWRSTCKFQLSGRFKKIPV